jgi:serpin B
MFLRLAASLLPVALLTSAAGAVGCSASSSPGQPGAAAHSVVQRDTSPSVAASDLATLVDDNTRFAIDSYRALGTLRAGQNVVFAPYSISSALAMTNAGAGGTTATEMASALDYGLPQARLHPAFDALDLALAARAPSVVLHVANSLCAYDKETFGQPFLDTIARDYGAGVRMEDFVDDPEGSREQINGWVADETNQKIQELLGRGTVTSATRLVLVNAIDFDGDWDVPFDAGASATAAFTRLDGTPVQVPTMIASKRTLAYVRTSYYDAIELPYKGQQMALDVVAPKQGTFAAFESGLTSEGLRSLLAGLTRGFLQLAMPKFKLEGVSVDLVPILEGLGMKEAFDPHRADFTAIARDPGGPLYVDGVVHKAFVSVDEKGTQAGAATAVGVRTALAPSVSIRVDRPFFFVLRDLPTGAILFAGRVTDPSAN